MVSFPDVAAAAASAEEEAVAEAEAVASEAEEEAEAAVEAEGTEAEVEAEAEESGATATGALPSRPSAAGAAMGSIGGAASISVDGSTLPPSRASLSAALPTPLTASGAGGCCAGAFAA